MFSRDPKRSGGERETTQRRNGEPGCLQPRGSSTIERIRPALACGSRLNRKLTNWDDRCGDRDH
jgi:hypothetical protein